MGSRLRMNKTVGVLPIPGGILLIPHDLHLLKGELFLFYLG